MRKCSPIRRLSGSFVGVIETMAQSPKKKLDLVVAHEIAVRNYDEANPMEEFAGGIPFRRKGRSDSRHVPVSWCWRSCGAGMRVPVPETPLGVKTRICISTLPLAFQSGDGRPSGWLSLHELTVDLYHFECGSDRGFRLRDHAVNEVSNSARIWGGEFGTTPQRAR